MKFLAVLISSLSLLAINSFAVSLTPPLVLKMQEDRTMASSDFAAEEAADQDLNFFKPAVGVISSMLFIFGIAWAGVGLSKIHDEDSKVEAMIGGGLGMAVLGTLGFYWAF